MIASRKLFRKYIPKIMTKTNPKFIYFHGFLNIFSVLQNILSFLVWRVF